MRRDLLLGFIIAVSLHLSVGLYSHLTKRAAPIKDPVAQLDPVPLRLLPVEPLEVAKTDDKDDEVIKTPPPPKQPDPFQLPDLKDFVITPDAPRPIEPTAKFAAYTIPEGLGGGTGPRAFTPSEVDRIPQAVLQGAPVYPATMRSQHVTGEVVVHFVVDANSNVREVRVVSSSDRAFEAAAIQAVRKWKFKAGTKGGRAVPVQLEIPIRFNLK